MYHYESKYGAGRTDGVHVRDMILRTGSARQVAELNLLFV